MKQEATKKMPKWLLPVIIAAAVLVVAGILLAIFLPGLGQGGSGAVQSKLYWNVDRLANIEEQSGMSMREKGADGLYAIRFAVDGEQVEYKTADKRLVNAIDMQDLMGLVFDADGLIVDLINPKEIATEVAKDFFVKEHKGNTLVVNSSQAMNGMPMQIEITENTGIYNVTPSAEVVGQRETTFTIMDKVIVYANAEGENTHIFIVQRFEEAGVYYRLARKYDANLASTTREPDENGVYTVEFAHNGEQVDVKIKDKALVDTIDAGKKLSSPQMGLLFDEEGYAIKKIPVEEAIRGKQLFGYWHVTSVEGTTINMQARWSSLSTKGETDSFELPEDFKDIFLMETDCGATHAGMRVDSLQKDDLVYVYTDFENNPLLIFVIRRSPGYPLFYNKSVKYDSTAKETTRKPDENGYYVYEVASEGKAMTVKTKDKEIATKVDKCTRYLVGLKLEGNIIVDACTPECVTGRATAGSGRYVTELLGTIVRMASASDMTAGANYVINPECKVYDVSDYYGVKYGAETELRLGDRVQAARNPEGELVAIYVYARYEEGSKIFFNPSRLYDSKTKETTRTPNEEGYYVFKVCSDGKWLEVKTKNKAMATYIDKQSTKFVALRVSSDGTIKGAYNVLSAIKYGYATLKNVYYNGINEEGKVTYYTLSKGVKTNKVGHVKAANCIVYNTSTAYINNRGEKSSLQKDDYIYAFGSRENFQVSQIWIRGREIDGPLYWGVNPQFDDAKGETARTPAADGYYYIDVVKDGKIITVKTKDKAIASDVDDYSYAFGLILKGDVVLRAVGATSVKDIEGYAYRNTYVKAINGDKVILRDTVPSSENYGKDLELVFTKNSKIYDVSSGAEPFGQATQLKVGDKIASYQDADGKVLYCFIRSRGATFGTCNACYEQALAAGKTKAEAETAATALWEVFDETTTENGLLTSSFNGKHFYLTKDQEVDGRFMRVYGNYKVCVDLKGYNVTNTNPDAKTELFCADGGDKAVLNIMDSKGTSVITAQGHQYTTRGAAIRVNKGTCNVYGGTFRRTENGKDYRLVTLAADTTLNVYGGTFEGQLYSAENVSQKVDVAPTRNTIYAPDKSTLNICGGTITGGVDVYNGAALTLAGAPKITGLSLGTKVYANIDKLTANAKIELKNDTARVISKPSSNAAAVKNCFTPGDDLLMDVTAKGELQIVFPAAPEWTDNAFTTDFDPANNNKYGYCEACFKNSILAGMTYDEAVAASLQRWKVYDGTNYEKDNHYYLTADYTIDAADDRFLSVVSGSTCLNLNGHNVTATNKTDRALVYVYGNGIVNVMDAKGTGVLSGYGERYAGSGTVIELRSGSPAANIYGGIFQSSSAKAAIGVHNTDTTPTMNICGGTIAGINVREGATLTLIDAPQITGLNLMGNAVADITGLLPDARIGVEGESGKILTAPNPNAAALKDCFIPVQGMEVIVNGNNELVLNAPIPAFTAGAFTTDFDPAANAGYAYCEACYKQAMAAGATEVEAQEASLKQWTVFIGGAPDNGAHYYLDQNFENYNATTRFMDHKGSGTVCWNLNGKTVTMSTASTEALSRITTDGGVLNIMDAKGTGVLAGYEFGTAGTNSGATVEIRNGGSVNIYGGDFRRVDGSAANVAIGGHSTVSGAINIYGGVIDGVYVRSGATATLAGAPVITGLSTGTDVVVNIDGLLPAAQISVKGSEGKIFTAPSDNAAAVVDCFTTVTDGLDVEVNDQKELVIVTATVTPDPTPDPDPEPTVDPFTEGFDPANNNNMAYCEACYKQALAAGMTEQEALDASLKEWTVFTGGDATNGKHYYLTENFENYNDTARFMNLAGDTNCWNLNGKTVTMSTESTEALCRVTDNSLLNIMDAKGTGVLTGYEYGTSGVNSGTAVEVRGNGIVNIYGGIFRRAEGSAANVAVGGHNSTTGELNIYGGTFDGVYVRTDLNATLSGAPQITNLGMSDGRVVNIDGLLPAAQISVKGSEGKIFTAPSDNAAAVKDCFTAVTEGLDVDVNDQKQLVIIEATAAPEVDPFTEGFDPANNNNMAYCEACYKQALAAGMNETEAKEASLKEWTVFTGGEAANNTHYYLTQSFTGDNVYNATRQFMTLADDTVCWNLNGQSITMAETAASGKSTRSVARVTGASTLNIMDAKGTGVLTGFKNVTVGKYGGSVVEVWDSSNLNIYGGTFRRTAEQGTLSAVGFTSDWTGTANIYGGDIEGIYKRTVGTVNLIGAPVITRLQMASGATYNIDGLLPAAQIAVMGAVDTIFTVPSDNAATVKGSFTAETDGLVVDVNDQKQLVIVEAPAEPTYAAQFVVDWVEANKAAFRAEGKLVEGATVEAPCPFCSPDANVTWTGTAATAQVNLTNGCHVYLTEDRNAGNEAHNFLVGSSSATSHCVYFNGFNVGNGENTSATRIRARGNLNIIAYGSTITRSANCAASTGTYGTMMLQGGGVATFYGGTYINNDSRVNLVASTKSEYTLNIYDATLIDNNSVTIDNAGTLSLHNCTVNGVEGKDAIANTGILTMIGCTVNGAAVEDIIPDNSNADQQADQQQEGSTEATKN